MNTEQTLSRVVFLSQDIQFVKGISWKEQSDLGIDIGN